MASQNNNLTKDNNTTVRIVTDREVGPISHLKYPLKHIGRKQDHVGILLETSLRAGIATGYGLDDQGGGSSSPGGGKNFTSPCRPDRP
jgi:hypothetical protein